MLKTCGHDFTVIERAIAQNYPQYWHTSIIIRSTQKKMYTVSKKWKKKLPIYYVPRNCHLTVFYDTYWDPFNCDNRDRLRVMLAFVHGTIITNGIHI